VFKTSDGNRTWQHLTIPPSTPCDGDCQTVGYDLQWISCQSGQSCCAGGSTFIDSHTGYANAMIRTLDSGMTWKSTLSCHAPPCLTVGTTSATCPTTSICTGVYYQPLTPNTGPFVNRTTNGGSSWSTEDLPVILTSIACSGTIFCELAGPHGKVAV